MWKSLHTAISKKFKSHLTFLYIFQSPAIEISNNKKVMCEITSEINNNVQNNNETSRQQRKCLSCVEAGHYKKKMFESCRKQQ
jgi:hypothetical protein